MGAGEPERRGEEGAGIVVTLDRYGGPEDRELTIALESDPRVMQHLGGPRSPEDLEKTHRRRAATGADGGCWYAIVVTTDDGPSSRPRRVGEIGMFKAERGGEQLDEVGWSLLPEYQGRGIARRALEQLIRRLEAEHPPTTVVATPATSNEPSNALCRSFGFELVAEGIEIVFRGRTMICNDWRLRLPRDPD